MKNKLSLENLKSLKDKALKATKGKYKVSKPLISEEEMYYKNHGGWRTDSFLEVEEAFDSINEEHCRRQNTPEIYRRKYSDCEKIINSFSYRGPAQTHANAEFIAALDPDTVLELIALAEMSLKKSGGSYEG